MNLASVLTTAKRIEKAKEKVMRYIERDQKASYALRQEVTVSLKGDGILLVPKSTYTTGDGSLTIALVDGPAEQQEPEAIRITAHTFGKESNLWNGPDVIPNNKYRSMLASLFHDLIWEHCDEIAEAWDCTSQEVLEWGNGVLYSVWSFASADSAWGRFEARVAWGVCQVSKRWYHKVRRLLKLAPVIALLFMVACFGPPQWTVVELTGGEEVEKVMREQGDGLSEIQTQSADGSSGQAIERETEDALPSE